MALVTVMSSSPGYHMLEGKVQKSFVVLYDPYMYAHTTSVWCIACWCDTVTSRRAAWSFVPWNWSVRVYLLIIFPPPFCESWLSTVKSPASEVHPVDAALYKS